MRVSIRKVAGGALKWQIRAIKERGAPRASVNANWVQVPELRVEAIREWAPRGASEEFLAAAEAAVAARLQK